MKILLASPIDPAAVVALERDFDLRSAIKAEPAALREAVADREVVVVRSGVQLSADVLSAAPNLRLLLRAGSGLDNIDLDCAPGAGHPGGSRRRNVGATGRRVHVRAAAVAGPQGHTRRPADPRKGDWPKPDLGGPLLLGKTLGVVGAGNIGGLVGEMGHAWGMRVLGCVAHPGHDRGRRAWRAGASS